MRAPATTSSDPASVIDAWLDLLLGSRCSACAEPGRALCRRCAAGLPTKAALCWPSPTPPGLVPPWSAGEYADALRALVVDHKDHGRLALVGPLGRLLALSAEAALSGGRLPGGRPSEGRLQLVPVPSHPSVVRSRGQDPLLRITHRAAAVLRGRGVPVVVRPALRVVARPLDQSHLDAGQRARNVAGRFAARERLAGSCTAGGPTLLVDDVVTTGATLREAQRALEAVGVRPFAAATVAATRRRLDGGCSGPRLSDPRLPNPSEGG
jgi:predicted amidophosphoribosyltransferase